MNLTVFKQIAWENNSFCYVSSISKVAPTSLCRKQAIDEMEYCWDYKTFTEYWGYLLREKCPNTEFFLVRIFLYSD